MIFFRGVNHDDDATYNDEQTEKSEANNPRNAFGQRGDDGSWPSTALFFALGEVHIVFPF